MGELFCPLVLLFYTSIYLRDAPMKKEIKWSILLPTLDEAESLPSVIQKIYALGLGKDAEVIIIDGGSTDGTHDAFLSASRRYPRLQWLDAPKGKGLALKIGFAKAKGKHFAFMDADMQYMPADLKRAMNAIERGADIVVTKRKVHGGSAIRRMLSLSYSNVFGKCMLGLPVQDPQSGMKAIRGELLKGLKLSSKEWALDSEIILQAARKGAKIKEIEIDFYPRMRGRTKTSVFGTGSDLVAGAVSFVFKGID